MVNVPVSHFKPGIDACLLGPWELFTTLYTYG